MRTRLLFFIAAFAPRALFGADEVQKLSLECEGKKRIYSDFVQFMTGGRSRHFILVYDEGTDLPDVRIESEAKPTYPAVPYVSIERVKFPLGAPGVYFLKREKDGLAVEFLMAEEPKKADRKSVEEFICLILKRPSSQKELTEWVRIYLQRIADETPNKAPQPTTTSVMPAANPR